MLNADEKGGEAKGTGFCVVLARACLGIDERDGLTCLEIGRDYSLRSVMGCARGAVRISNSEGL